MSHLGTGGSAIDVGAQSRTQWPSVVNQEFVLHIGARGSEFLVMNHTSKQLFLVSFVVREFATEAAARTGRIREPGI